MKVKGYKEEYLNDARTTLAEAMDYAVNVEGIKKSSFMKTFIASSYALNFERGNPSVIAGRSGMELVLDIYDEMGMTLPLMKCPPSFTYTQDYWCGWILSYIQWNTGAPFSYLEEVMPIDELSSLYPILHEVSDEKAMEVILERIKAKKLPSRLKKMRQSRNLTQKELSELSFVNKRTLEEYESKSKDLSKASFSTVYDLSMTLHCNMKDILEFF